MKQKRSFSTWHTRTSTCRDWTSATTAATTHSIGRWFISSHKTGLHFIVMRGYFSDCYSSSCIWDFYSVLLRAYFFVHCVNAFISSLTLHTNTERQAIEFSAYLFELAWWDLRFRFAVRIRLSDCMLGGLCLYAFPSIQWSERLHQTVPSSEVPQHPRVYPLQVSRIHAHTYTYTYKRRAHTWLRERYARGLCLLSSLFQTLSLSLSLSLSICWDWWYGCLK